MLLGNKEDQHQKLAEAEQAVNEADILLTALLSA